MLMARDAIELRQMDLVEKVLCGEEIRSMASLQRPQTEADCEMGFADAGRPEKSNSFGALDKGKSPQLVDDPPIQRGLRIKIKGLQTLEHREMRELGADGDASFLSGRDFLGEQMIEKVDVGEVTLFGVAEMRFK
jgi:hypothetical protein